MFLDPKQPSLLRNRLWWVLLLVVPYAISFSWLSFAVLWFPFVVGYAPFGLTSLFGVSDPDNPATAFVHIVFWSIYLGAFVGVKRVNASILRVTFVALAGVLMLTCYGCAANHTITNTKFHMNCGTTPNKALQPTALTRGG